MAESKKSIYAAIAADTGIAVSKFVAGRVQRQFQHAGRRDPLGD